MTTWIIERDINDAAEALAGAAAAAGHSVVRWEEGMPLRAVDPARCVFLGSLTSCGAVPGVIGDPERLFVRSWLPEVVDLALNPDPVYTTVGEVGALSLTWRRVFARPDSPMKPFAGRVLDRDELCPEALDHGFYYDDLTLPVVLAEAVEVKQEWRFVAVDRELIAHSGYVADGRSATASTPPAGATDAAHRAARRSPEPTVVIDICETGSGEYKLVEYNLFSGADLYGCDSEAIVRALAAPG